MDLRKKIIACMLLLSASCSLFAGQGKIAKANEIDIWYETFGNKKNPSLLLIMGGCCQGVLWPQEFCERLASEGFYVIRYDHRDAGLSTCFDFDTNPYNLMEMTQDVVGLLDAIGIERAHLFGVSLGAFLSEMMAAYYPERVNTILLLSSSCELRPMNLAYAGFPSEKDAIYSSPTQEYLNWMQEFMKLSPHTEEEKLAQRIDGWNKLNGQKIPLDEKINREIHQEFLSRLCHPQGILNHIKMLNTRHSEDLFRSTPSKIKVPTVVLQGSEDPIFPPDHGIGLAQKIKHSKYFLVEGMGHVPGDHFYDLYIRILKEQALIN